MNGIQTIYFTSRHILHRTLKLGTNFIQQPLSTRSYGPPQVFETYHKFSSILHNIQLTSRKFSTTRILFDDEDNDDVLRESEEFQRFREEARVKISGADHNVFIIQPFIKWGEKKKRNTTRELMLQESEALVKSIQGWSVSGSTIISLTSFHKKSLFGKGSLEMLVEKVRNQKVISAVFVSVDVLKLHQQKNLQDLFGVPVFDRYMVVIQIFKGHATTKEAHLQIALAELPYLWTRYRTIEDATNMNISKGFLDSKREALMRQEKKLKRALIKLKSHREIKRSNRERMDFPVIAVVGYTNCGKTTLIKALTGDNSLAPLNQLFATLDVTTHEGLLANRLKVLYVDTIGFISNIPTNLLEPFKVTLEDAMLADIIVHVVDISNPDFIQQKEHVDRTLHGLELEEKLRSNVLVVGNKVDLLASSKKTDFEDVVDLFVSAVKGTGLNELKERIEEMVVKATGRFGMSMRVKNGGNEYTWLLKQATVSNIEEDPSSAEHLILDVILDQATLDKFKHTFIFSVKKNV